MYGLIVVIWTRIRERLVGIRNSNRNLNRQAGRMQLELVINNGRLQGSRVGSLACNDFKLWFCDQSCCTQGSMHGVEAHRYRSDRVPGQSVTVSVSSAPAVTVLCFSKSRGRIHYILPVKDKWLAIETPSFGAQICRESVSKIWRNQIQTQRSPMSAIIFWSLPLSGEPLWSASQWQMI